MTVFYCDFDSRFGRVRLVGDGAALSGLYFMGQKHEPAPGAHWIENADAAPFAQAREQFARYERGELHAFDVPLRLEGSAFRRSVWKVLRDVPYGSTVSYGELSRKLGMPKAARAVAGAVAHNPVTVLVPCHRVIGSDGALTGYAGGLARKEALLALEHAL